MSASVLKPVVSSVWEEQQLTHMPFLCRDGQLFILVFARSFFVPRHVPQYSHSGTTRIWRLAWAVGDPHSGHWGAVKPLRTGLALNEIECSPCVSFEGSRVHVSFIGTLRHGTGQLAHRLFRMSGPNLDRLSSAAIVHDDECFSGFWRPDLTASSNGRDGRIHLQGSINSHLETGFEQIARVSFDADAPQRLLITGVVPGETQLFGGQPQCHTIVYDVARDAVLGEVRVAGSAAYKPALTGGWVAHVQPRPQSTLRESWKIELDNRVTQTFTPITVTRLKH